MPLATFSVRVAPSGNERLLVVPDPPPTPPPATTPIIAAGTLTDTQVLANASEKVNIAVPGAQVGDLLFVSVPQATPDGLTFGAARISSADSGFVLVANPTGAPINTGALVLPCILVRPAP